MRNNSASEHTLKHKIEPLFQLRLIQENITWAKIENATEFLNDLIVLQDVIYQLDHYLESNWDIEQSALDFYWEGIFQALAPFGISRNKCNEFCGQILKYLFTELDMRDGQWPSDKSFDTVYTDKSCDVKLLRSLIYRASPKLEDTLHESDWHWYDLITEVNDDIQDVYEDKKSYNGNCFLISVLRHGISNTYRNYKTFIQDIQKHADAAYEARLSQKEVQELAKNTSIQVIKTLKLLETRIHQSSMKKLQSAKIAQKFRIGL